MTGLTRRSFLGASALAASAMAVSSCDQAPSDALQRLRIGFDGEILLPGREGWLQYAVPTAQRYASTPRAIAICAGESDVQHAYAFAMEQQWPFAVRGGGHSYAGFSCTDGLLISTRGLDRVAVDPRSQTVTVGAGALLGPLLTQLQDSRQGLILPIGRCNGVGIAGLTLGGGWGFWARLYGLMADHLVNARIMTPDGVIREVSADQHDDLFWALRGGGGGNFGICTSFTFRAIPVPPQVTVFQLMWMDQSVLPEVLHELMQIAVTAPREFTIEPVTSPLLNYAIPGQDPPNPIKLTVTGQYTGARTGLERVIGSLLDRFPPSSKEAIETDFWAAHQYLADSTPVGWFCVDSGFLTAALSLGQAREVISMASQWPGGSVLPDSNWGFFSMGGAIADVPPTATAFPHRDAAVMVKLETSWADSDSRTVTEAGLDWLRGFTASQRSDSGMSGAYVNFCNRDTPDWAHAYYGPNLPRLVEIKRRWDPDRAFAFAQAIPTRLDTPVPTGATGSPAGSRA